MGLFVLARSVKKCIVLSWENLRNSAVPWFLASLDTRFSLVGGALIGCNLLSDFFTVVGRSLLSSDWLTLLSAYWSKLTDI